jgi:ABC-type ATPase involved in cell division
LLIATHDQAIYDFPGSKVIKIENGRLAIQKPPTLVKKAEVKE